jgi:predicted RNA-binding Zn ribbon-like protein
MPLSSRPLPAPPQAIARPERHAALFVGNALWLDFVNTRYVEHGRPVDLLQGFGALVDWLASAGTLPAEEVREAIARWDGTPQGARVLSDALALRDALRDLAASLASGSSARAGSVVEESAPVAAADRAAPPVRSAPSVHATHSDHAAPDAMAMAASAINGILRANVCYDELVLLPDRADTAAPFARHARRTNANPLRILAPVADSASELLCGSGDPSRVRRCGNPRCVLYFYDTTKNRRRRFCSAAGCGNRVKAAARYRRSRASEKVDPAE